MKMKKIFLTSAVALALLSSCNNDYDGQDIAGTKLAVSASIDQVNTSLHQCLQHSGQYLHIHSPR